MERELIVQISRYEGLCMYVCMYAVTLQECNNDFLNLTHTCEPVRACAWHANCDVCAWHASVSKALARERKRR